MNRNTPHLLKENRVLFIILPLILLLCYGIWYFRVDADSELLVLSDTPEWDLRAVDFDGDQFVRARGFVAEYVPNALLTPQEFEAADYIVGEPKNAAQYLTSRFRLYVPEGRVYALMTHSVDYADRIYINGQLYQEIGKPADNRADMVPQTLTQYYTVVPENGVIEIVQQVSNFVHREGGNPTGFRIGSIETAGRHYNRTVNMAAVTIGCCLLLFVVHMVLFLMQPGYRANLYLSLFCLVIALQVAVSGARVIAALFPRISWALTFRIGYLSVPLTALLAALALGAMFEGLLQRPVKWAAYALLGIACLLYLFIDTVTMSYLTLIVNPLCIALAVYIAARLLWRVRQRDKRGVELTIVLCGVAALAYALLRDTLYHNNILIPPMVSANLMDFSVLVFVLFQMTASFYGTMREVAAERESAKIARLEAETMRQAAMLKEALHESIPDDHLIIRGALTLNTLAGQVYMHDKDLLLTQKEFAMLLHLMQHEDEMVSKAALFEQVWRRSYLGNENALKSTMYRLRKKIETSGYQITSERGKGYIFTRADDTEKDG